ncbi:hypothetical protein ACFWD7_51990 [Streptomyces mirabilis]|uniref:hypothetical protein n=1 Tax=Streptomyces mirabilis TaxID=68239 RepID=UPI0036BF2E80
MDSMDSSVTTAPPMGLAALPRGLVTFEGAVADVLALHPGHYLKPSSACPHCSARLPEAL